MSDYETPEQQCPYCGFSTDRAGCITSTKGNPSPGDQCLCINCGKVTIFEDSMGNYRKPTTEEADEIMSDPLIIQAQILLAGLKEQQHNEQSGTRQV